MISEPEEYTRREIRVLRLERFILWALVVGLAALLFFMLEGRIGHVAGVLESIQGTQAKHETRLTVLEEKAK